MRIPGGESFFASDECPVSINCPIAEGRTITNDYSCGYARAFAIQVEQLNQSIKQEGE